MGAASIGSTKLDVTPDAYVGTSTAVYLVALSSTYATGGDTLALAAAGLEDEPYKLNVEPTSSGYSVQVIYQGTTTVKLKVRDTAGAEITNGTDLSGEKLRIQVIGPYNTV